METASQSVGTLCVIPIGLPFEIQTELQGWRRPNGPFVENEFSQRCYPNYYGKKWPAFSQKAEDRDIAFLHLLSPPLTVA